MPAVTTRRGRCVTGRRLVRRRARHVATVRGFVAAGGAAGVPVAPGAAGRRWGCWWRRPGLMTGLRAARRGRPGGRCWWRRSAGGGGPRCTSSRRPGVGLACAAGPGDVDADLAARGRPRLRAPTCPRSCAASSCWRRRGRGRPARWRWSMTGPFGDGVGDDLGGGDRVPDAVARRAGRDAGRCGARRWPRSPARTARCARITLAGMVAPQGGRQPPRSWSPTLAQSAAGRILTRPRWPTTSCCWTGSRR